MKSKKKVVTLLACAVLLVVGSVLGTLAYLTSQATVTNTFTVGDVEITLDEAKANADGILVANADRVKANSYKLLPGHTYAKDPTVHVDANSEDSWLFVKVENEIADIEALGNTVASQMQAKGWSLIEGTGNIYAYEKSVTKGENVVVFEEIEVSGTIDNATLSAYAENTITVTAYAVQKDGFATAKAAWEATFGAPSVE